MMIGTTAEEARALRIGSSPTPKDRRTQFPPPSRYKTKMTVTSTLAAHPTRTQTDGILN